MAKGDPWVVRTAGTGDAAAAASLLHDFNREYGDPTPGVAALTTRIRDLLDAGDTTVLLGGAGPDDTRGVAVLRFRTALWSPGLECYLAELYVVPALRGRGLGRALMDAALDAARALGADTMDLGTSEDDVAARHLYERLGFTNLEGGPDGPAMLVYELDL